MTPALTPIDPYNDPRVTHKLATVRGRTHRYIEGLPEGTEKATVVCVHGFPDLWYGWRTIIPFLLQEGLRVIVPDMMGYGGTDAPNVPPETLEVYGWKHSADDIAALLKELDIPKVILLGHDWGGAIVGRIHLYHPEIVSHIASFVAPYPAVNKDYYPIEVVVEQLPNFTYQIGLIQPDVEEGLKQKENISKFIRALIRLRPDNAKLQVRCNLLQSLGDQPRCMLSEKELDYYVDTFYAKENKFHGPLNWYKIRKQNFEDEKDYFEKDHVHVPYLFVGGSEDVTLPPAMWDAQKALIDNLTFRHLPTGHWPMAEDPQGCTGLLKEWFDGVVFGDKMKLE